MNQSFVSSSVMGCHQEAELWAGHWVSSRPASCRPHSSTGAMTWPGLRVGASAGADASRGQASGHLLSSSQWLRAVVGKLTKRSFGLS